MNIIQLIFKLLYEFVPMDSAEYAKMVAEGKEWYSRIQFDDEFISGAKGSDALLAKAKKLSEIWYMRALFAILYLVGKRQLTLYTNPTFAAGEPDED